MNKIIIFVLIITLSVCTLTVEGADEQSILEEIGYMKVLHAILNDPVFLAMSYPEQYKLLDDFYNHVDEYIKMTRVEKNT